MFLLGWTPHSAPWGCVTGFVWPIKTAFFCRWWLQHEIKRPLLLGRKVMTNLDSILKSRDITLPTKVHLVKAMAFPVVVYGCWTVNKAECWTVDAFELWFWRRLLRVPWTARRSNQSWIFIGSTDVEAETPILWPPDAKNQLILKDTDAGKDWGWCTGTTQKDGMGREEGRGFRMGNTCIPVADSFWYLAKLIQLCKV